MMSENSSSRWTAMRGWLSTGVFGRQKRRVGGGGYRIMESLYAGRFCYVDDLVTDQTARSLGYGGALFDWLVAEARAAGCGRLELDSGVQRFDAHRFYLTTNDHFIASLLVSRVDASLCEARRRAPFAIEMNTLVAASILAPPRGRRLQEHGSLFVRATRNNLRSDNCRRSFSRSASGRR
jgi:hypothetical protein